MALLANTGFYGFIASCKKEAKKYKEYFESGRKGYGWKIWEYKSGKYKLETDELAVREQVRSADYDDAASDMERKGFLIETNYRVGDTEITGYSRAEFDEIFVRKRAVFKEIVIEQLNSIAGGLVISATHGKIAAAENVMYQNNSSCFVVLEDGSESPDKVSTSDPVGSTDTPNGSTPNSSGEDVFESSSTPAYEKKRKPASFIRGDMALCERADYDETTHYFEKKRYWMLVEKAGLTSDENCPLSDELKAAGEQYLVLSFKYSEPYNHSSPAPGDALVQFGYIPEYGDLTVAANIKDRQRAVTISQLMDSHGAFVEYQGLGNSKPYFEVRSSHVVTRICGNGSNKFTGEFIVSSGSSSINLKEYVNQSKEEATETAVGLARNAINSLENVFKTDLETNKSQMISAIGGLESTFKADLEDSRAHTTNAIRELDQYLQDSFESIGEITESKFEVLNELISSEVLKISKDIETLNVDQATLKQYADEIELKVTNITKDGGTLSHMQSVIDQRAGQIELKVAGITEDGGTLSQMQSAIDLLPTSISATVKGKIGEEHKEAGLDIKLEKDSNDNILGGHIEMQADKVKILNGSKTAALFTDGKLNAELIDTNNLIVRGSIAEVPHPLDPGDLQNDVYLNFENGFNFAGRNDSPNTDRNLYLPSGSQYNGVRCTIVNTGYNSTHGPLILNISNQKGDICAEFFTNRNLKTCLLGPGPTDTVGIGQVRIESGGIIHLYAFLQEQKKETLNENGESIWVDDNYLYWYIENMDAFAISNFWTQSFNQLVLQTYAPTNKMSLIYQGSFSARIGVASVTYSVSNGTWTLIGEAPSWKIEFKDTISAYISYTFDKALYQRYMVYPVVGNGIATAYVKNLSSLGFSVGVRFPANVENEVEGVLFYVMQYDL